jgi:hypothetical protein
LIQCNYFSISQLENADPNAEMIVREMFSIHDKIQCYTIVNQNKPQIDNGMLLIKQFLIAFSAFM